MSSFVRYCDEEIDLSAVTPLQRTALWELYDNRRSYRDGHRMPLQCVKPHGGRMYLKVRTTPMTPGTMVFDHESGGGGVNRIQLQHHRK
jgi:hypothetical protein